MPKRVLVIVPFPLDDEGVANRRLQAAEIDLGPDVTHIHVLPQLNCPLRESLALLATMDVFVGPASGLVHAAGALRVPTVALFGPFEAGQRVTRYPPVRSIQGRAPCAPCHHHPRTLEQRWPAGKPCQQMQHCVALAGITGQQVLERVREILDIAIRHGADVAPHSRES